MSSQEAPSSYTELARVLDNLPLLLKEARRARGLSVRAAADELDISPSTVSRIENGHDAVVSNSLAVLRWLDTREDAARPSDRT